MNIEEMIQAIVTQMMPLFNKKVVLFVSGGNVNVEKIIKILSKFNLANYSIVFSENAKEILENKFVEKLKANIINDTEKVMEDLIDCDIVLIPVMTRNTLSKVALGISDNILTTGISRAIMLKKEIIALRDSFCSENPINIAKGFSKNKNYNLMISNYEKTLESFGVKFVDSEEFKDSLQYKFNNFLSEDKQDLKINSELSNMSIKEINKTQEQDLKGIKIFKESILTVKDISKFLVGKELNLTKDSIITPLAKDFIYNNKIKINYC
ncbi:flavoprotein [Clostridium novyi]|uniref:Phosphopantothenate--cysteine ligase, putative n=1 Tax=Clostridium novyi (strain NT) TaxID=386415 RepID=A0Q2V8_CLONN|nr:flavoprotein [Clostridium novyi]ABK62105.1 phosphopantothenate--cysteine ligase, putative [Clostridium novyi NT]KEH86487.1 hypothetical protein Z966_02675 [Clostridium novyi A str. NCTC 538]